MKTHTTNYYDTFIQVAADCQASFGEIPPAKDGIKSVASIQYNLISSHPYHFSSDDILFEVYVIKNEILPLDRKRYRQQFFSKGQPCLRSSPLAKRYGWGIHSNSEGKVAIFGVGSKEYENLVKNENIKQLQAMRTSKKQ